MRRVKEDTVAGQWMARGSVALLLILMVAWIVGCGGETLPPEPTPSPGARFLMPTPGPSDTPLPYTATPEAIVYKVVAGDTLYAIALRYGVDVDELARFNGLEDPNSLTIGQELLIPLNPQPTETPSP